MLVDGGVGLNGQVEREKGLDAQSIQLERCERDQICLLELN